MDKVEKIFQRICEEIELEAQWIEDKLGTSKFLSQTEREILLAKLDCLVIVKTSIKRALKQN